MKYFLSLILLTQSILCIAQSTTSADPQAVLPFIEVSGTATKEVVPDKIFISIVLTEKKVNNEDYSIQAQEEKLKNILTRLNIGTEKLFLSNANSELTIYKKKETGFKVAKAYTLEVRNSTEVSQVFKALYDLNIKEAEVVNTDHTKIDSLRKEVRIAAIKAAKEKAQYLLSAIGETIGKPVEIREEANRPYFQNSLLSNNVLMSAENQTNQREENEISYNKLTIKFSYYIKYAIR